MGSNAVPRHAQRPQTTGHVRLPAVPAGGYTLVLVGRPVQFGDFDAFKMLYVLPTP